MNSNYIFPESTSKEDIKLKIQRIYKQFTEGCGRTVCPNPNCASNPNFPTHTKKQAINAAIGQIKRPNNSFYFCEPIQAVDALKIKTVLRTNDQNEIEKINPYIYKAFSSVDVLEISFRFSDNKNYEVMPTEQNPQINFDSLIEIYHLLVNDETSKIPLCNSIFSVCDEFLKKINNIEYFSLLRVFFIIVLNPLLADPVNIESFIKLCYAIRSLNKIYTNVLVEWMTQFTKKILCGIIELIHQYISIEIYTINAFSENVILMLELLEIIHQSNEISKIVEYFTFYNDAVNDLVASKRRFVSLMATSKGFYKLERFYYVFDPASKSKILLAESQKQMQKQINQAMLSNIFGYNVSPYLKIVVRRDSIIQDTLRILQSRNPAEYKKPLKVIFKGELGVDEGGVQKEFFQLIVRNLFLPEYGMFEYNKNTRQFWFNKNTLDNNLEFELIGSIIGLAIYNGIILNLKFPDIVYQKLLEVPVYSVEHLASLDQELAKGLKDLLNFKGDVKETYMRTFSIEYDVFGSNKIVDLKPNGRNIPLTNENRKEYVDLYINYILNGSIQEQFHHFYKGFYNVCSSPFFNKFHWKELELLVCGSQTLDFNALEKSAKYQDGYTKDSQAVKFLWQTLHSFSEEDKKNFLFFATGSDRVPIRGLGDLCLTVSKNGDEQERLPSAHTCFEHLLLPDYKTREKLEAKLRVALQNLEGFGLL